MDSNFGVVGQADSSQACADAVVEFGEVPERACGAAMSYFNIGVSYKETNRLSEAVDAFREAIAIESDFVAAHVGLATTLLLDGQLQEGFAEYEWRLRAGFTPLQKFGRAQWDGTRRPDITVLVYTERRHGDAIEFARYLPLLAAEGVSVILQCSASLQPLLRGVDGVAAAYSFDEALPDFDFHIPMLSLPHLFKTGLSDVPANVPYLFAPFERAREWGERLGSFREGVKIGLRWAVDAGGDGACPLKCFEVLADMPGVRFVSLQDRPLTGAEEASATRLGLVDFSADLHDLSDTAALVAKLDLVISVDAAVLHLAGALGKPAWALLKHAPHWPWMLDCELSPWYPGIHLFRQRRRDEWDSVLERVALVLRGVLQAVDEQ